MITRQVPPFRADHVGSLLRPERLKAVRQAHERGGLDKSALAACEDAEILEAVRRQEDIGLKLATDGELRRSWWHLDFLWGLVGIEPHALDAGVAFAGVTTRAVGVRVTGKIAFDEAHPMLDHYRFLHSHTRVTPKLTLPSPSALCGRPVLPPIDARIYPDREQMYLDLGVAYREAVRAFAAVGCRYLQLDEVFIAMLCDDSYRRKMTERGDDPDRLLALYARLINTAVAGAPDDMTITLHLCRGNFRSTFMGSGGYEKVQDVLFNAIDVDGYFLEYDDERSGGFEPLRWLPKPKVAALGIVTTKRGTLEDKDELKRQLDRAARYVDIDQLCLAPQCGFSSTEEGNLLSETEQWAKLERIVEVAAEVWK